MKVTAWTREALAIRRSRREHLNAGWEFVGEGGGRLWEMYRGVRIGHKIVAVEISADGMGVWVKTADAGRSFPTAPQARARAIMEGK